MRNRRQRRDQRIGNPVEGVVHGANYNDSIFMAHTITLIPGDGIGPEVTEAVVRVLAAAGVSIDWERHDAGVMAFERSTASRCRRS